MRVTTGLARGRKLVAPQGLDTRPSSDMTKQAVFNIVQNYVEGSTFLDLFAGSGQMGIEALSRGAKHAVFVDASPKAIQAVRENLAHCGFADKAKVAQMDAQSFLKSTTTRFDLVFWTRPTSSRSSMQCCRRWCSRWRPEASSSARQSATNSCPNRRGIMPSPKPTFTARRRLPPIAGRRKRNHGTTATHCGGAG